MEVDGEPLNVASTPAIYDLEAGDLIDAKVDFSKQNSGDIKRFVRLRLVLNGRRHEIFKMDEVRSVTSFLK